VRREGIMDTVEIILAARMPNCAQELRSRVAKAKQVFDHLEAQARLLVHTIGKLGRATWLRVVFFGVMVATLQPRGDSLRRLVSSWVSSQ